MVWAHAIADADASDAEKLIGFSPEEHPIVLQLGGSDPEKLARAAVIGARRGYDEINLNAGCPAGEQGCCLYGARLMFDPPLVAACCSAMRAALDASGFSAVPVSVKCRLGVQRHANEHAHDSYESLREFVQTVAAAGVRHFVVHARVADLSLNAARNRTVPPLHPERAVRLAREMPHLRFTLNGGLGSLEAAWGWLACGVLDGVMIGRRANTEPYLFASCWHGASAGGDATARVDSNGGAEASGAEATNGEPSPARSRREVLELYLAHMARAQPENWGGGHPETYARGLIGPLVGLFHDTPFGPAWRRELQSLFGRRDELRSTPAATLVRQCLHTCEVAASFLDSRPPCVVHPQQPQTLPSEAERAADEAAPAPAAAAPAAAACRHFRRGFCRLGTSCRFSHADAGALPATQGALSDRAQGRRTHRKQNLGRVSILRRWLVETFGRDVLASGSGVVDVAGGRGALSFELLNVHAIPSTVVDPRSHLALSRLVQQWERGRYHAQKSGEVAAAAAAAAATAVLPRHWRCYWQEATWRPLLAAESAARFAPDAAALADVAVALTSRPPLAERVLGDEGADDQVTRVASGSDASEVEEEAVEEEEATKAVEAVGGVAREAPPPPSLAKLPSATEACELLRDCSLIVGMHPDAATEAIVDFALAADKSFAVVPCCVFAAAFAQRRVGGRAVRTHAQLVAYLVAKDPERIRVATLPFAGRNVVVYYSRTQALQAHEHALCETCAQPVVV
jgi:tRNA-dihydrouridine synthase A